jgi:hypothetical protein
VQTAPPSSAELDRIREQAEQFLAERDEEEYLHFAGHKPDYDLEAVYERHADLTSLETALRVGEAVDGTRNRELWRFACEGYLGSLTRDAEERAAGLETSLSILHEGGELPYRAIRSAIANEPDRGARKRLEAQRRELAEDHLVPVHREGIDAAHDGACALGAASYAQLYGERFGFDLDGLAARCRAVLASTESLYETAIDRLLRARAGVSLADAENHDLGRLRRADEWDGAFPAGAMVPALRATLEGLGIRLDEQRNVHLDVEHRPTKSPRAFCSPIDVPGRVMLVIQPLGGPDDWQGLFHEAGHTEHFAHMSPSLAIEERKLGDNAVTEGWAALLELLVSDPAWLRRRLDVGRPHDFAADSLAVHLFFLRRYSAKLLYELELHAADDVTPLRGRYVELLADALKIEPASCDFLDDVDPSFYCSSYLRSWAFEAQLRDHLRGEYGDEWFARREAGSLLRELWELGQRPTAEELLKDVTGAELDLAAVEDRIRAAVR